MSYKIYIELSKRRLLLKNNNNIYGTYPVAVGKPSTPTPIGDFEILNKIMNPGGVLGTRWMQFTWQEHGIHGTNQPSSIGKAISLGCVRMYNHHAEAVYSQVITGTPVIIRNYLSNSSNNNNNNQNYFIYTVKKGDSLWKISRKFKIDLDDLIQLNKIYNDRIYPNQKLKIPYRYH